MIYLICIDAPFNGFNLFRLVRLRLRVGVQNVVVTEQASTNHRHNGDVIFRVEGSPRQALAGVSLIQWRHKRRQREGHRPDRGRLSPKRACWMRMNEGGSQLATKSR